jgi:Rrf2 family protein
MKLSTQEEYGLRCLMQLARQGDCASLTIGQLAQLEGISPPNSAKIMRLLRRAGFVKATRGQAGGYALARPAAAIVVGDVLSALGPRLFDEQFCERNAGSERLCAHAGDCSILPVLEQLQGAVDAVMGRLTLEDLLHGESRPAPAPLGSRAVGLRLITGSARA